MNSFLFDFSGTDSLLLARILVLLNSVFASELFKLRPDKVPSQEQLQQAYDLYLHAYEGGKYGDRNQIALRKQARLDLIDQCQKVLRFLESVAGDDDLTALQNAGIELRKHPRKKKAKSTSTTAN